MQLLPFAGLLRGSSAGANCREEKQGLCQQLGVLALNPNLWLHSPTVAGLFECSGYSVVSKDCGSQLTQHQTTLHPQQGDSSKSEWCGEGGRAHLYWACECHQAGGAAPGQGRRKGLTNTAWNSTRINAKSCMGDKVPSAVQAGDCTAVSQAGAEALGSPKASCLLKGSAHALARVWWKLDLANWGCNVFCLGWNSLCS